MKTRRPTSNVIDKEKVLIVDGNDEMNFYKNMLIHTGLCSESESESRLFEPDEKTQIDSRVCGKALLLSAGGKVENVIKNKNSFSGFSKIKVLGIIADAEKKAENRLRSIQDALEKNGLPVPSKPLQWVSGPPKTGSLIQPPGKEDGMIENMCLEAIKDDPIMSCIEEFLSCAQKRGGIEKKEGWSPKAKVRSFLATREDPDHSLGVAAKYWNLDAGIWEPLRAFLKKFYNS